MSYFLKKKELNISADLIMWIVAGVVSAGVTLVILILLAMGSGDTSSAAASAGRSIPLMDQFDMVVGNALSDSMGELLDMKKVYWIAEDAVKAPKPDPACAGTSQDPKELQWLLDDAETRLGVTDLLFSTDTVIEENTEIRYYLDDTIFSVSWKQPVGWCVYSFTEVKIAHPSQIRRFLSGGEYGSGVLYTTTDMANSVNAVSAASGDYYSYRPHGIMVYNGKLLRDTGEYLDTCYIDENGDMLFSDRNSLTTHEEMEAFIQENKVRFSLAFGPILVRDGVNIDPIIYSLGEVQKNFSRAALCQQGKLHYVVVTANTGYRKTGTPTMTEFAMYLQELGIRNAYALDGGQTATQVANGERFNDVDYGEERLISDIIYFATAIPDGQ